MPFRVGRPFTDAFYEYVHTDAEGLVAFEFDGLPLDGTLRVIEELPSGTDRFVVFCVDETGSALDITYVDYSASNPNLGVADVAVGSAGDVACDWYNVPVAEPVAAQETEEPTGTADPDEAPAVIAGPTRGRQALVHAGACDDLAPSPAFELSNIIQAEGEAEGPNVAIPAAASYTLLDVSLEELLATAHAIAVYPSDDVLERGEDPSVVACGAVGGIRGADGALLIGLREQNDSGIVGIAYLAPDSSDAGRTQVSVFAVERLADTGRIAGTPAALTEPT